jgi:uncharacterized protein with HEPN domain
MKFYHQHVFCMSNRDQTRFHHMLDAAQAAITHLSNRTRVDLDRDRLLLNGIIRELEILGEAASPITIETRERHPTLPWREMIGMRNRLIHAYFIKRFGVLSKSTSLPWLPSYKPLYRNRKMRHEISK